MLKTLLKNKDRKNKQAVNSTYNYVLAAGSLLLITGGAAFYYRNKKARDTFFPMCRTNVL
ncbi:MULTISPECIES: hypothetical protein [unclassified Virgibacillus]|uniref:hypothetical protein n=1 Tax=unclassified Virgibacillus TaxID=2620237 RepID=UPI0024DE5D3B|nr:hypothetical protein [Virgibacillus sp. LDC-1]